MRRFTVPVGTYTGCFLFGALLHVRAYREAAHWERECHADVAMDERAMDHFCEGMRVVNAIGPRFSRRVKSAVVREARILRRDMKAASGMHWAHQARGESLARESFRSVRDH